MSKPIIETYRGFEIFFDTETENFVIDTNEYRTEKKSYPALKKSIDEFLKDNAAFTPFLICGAPDSYKRTDKFKVIGIRKDNRFIAEDSKGKKTQISDYEEKYYILDLPENEIHNVNIAALEIEIDSLRKKIEAEKKLIKAPTLAEVKPKYIQP